MEHMLKANVSTKVSPKADLRPASLRTMGIADGFRPTRSGFRRWAVLLSAGALALTLIWKGGDGASPVEECEEANHVCGFIEAGFAEKVEDALAEPGPVRIQSYGGYAEDALEAARAILPARAAAEIDNVCISACVEVLLPAFHRVSLTNAPMVAAHGNARMRTLLAREQGIDTSSCAGDYLRGLHELLGSRLNPQNPRIQIDKLGVTGADFDWPEGQRCPSIYLNASADYWALTADDLAAYFGVQVVGETAADTPSVIQDRINCHFPIGDRVRVHDDILISRGHSGQPGCNEAAIRGA